MLPPKKKRRTKSEPPLLPPPPPPLPTPCVCPDFCADQPSGMMAYCEDGVWTPIPPPTVDSVLKFNASTGKPYWHPE